MNRSINPPVCAQPHFQHDTQQQRYIATTGQDLVEVGASLEWILNVCIDLVRDDAEDVAVWIVRPDVPTSLVALVRSSSHGCASVHLL